MSCAVVGLDTPLRGYSTGGVVVGRVVGAAAAPVGRVAGVARDPSSVE